jgi:hypothetical protein
MTFQRLAVTTVTLAAVALGLGGCNSGAGDAGSTGPAPATSSAPATSALDEFLAASKKLSGETLRMEMSMPGGMEATGVSDFANRKVEMTMSITMGSEPIKMSMRLIDQTLFIKYGAAPEWMSVDVSKLSPGNTLNPENMFNAEALASAATKVERTGDSFSGTIDMTKSPTSDPASLKALGAKATEVPFTGKVDGEGRLTEMAIDMSGLGAGAGSITTKYYDFGTKVDVEAPPAAQVKPMPADMLKAFSTTGA